MPKHTKKHSGEYCAACYRCAACQVLELEERASSNNKALGAGFELGAAAMREKLLKMAQYHGSITASQVESVPLEN